MITETLLSTLPTKEIVSLYNRIPGTQRVSRFETRTIAIRRTIDALNHAGLVLDDTGGIIDFADASAAASDNQPEEADIMPNAGPLAVAGTGDDDPFAIPSHLRREAPAAANDALEGEAEPPAESAAEDAPAAPTAVEGCEECPHCGRPLARRRERAPRPPREPRQLRAGGSKEAMVIEMLRGEDGVSIEEIADATGWQRHTIHGFFAGKLRKKLGLKVVRGKLVDGARVYSIVE